MPILINKTLTSEPGNNQTKYSDGMTPYTELCPSRYSREYKFGTGSRRKPATPDNTDYERRVIDLRAPYGVAIRKVPWGRVDTATGFLRLDNLGLDASLVAGINQTLDTNFRDLSNLKALNKFNQRDLDLGTAWLERGKTAELVAGVATTAVNALRCLKRRDGRGLLNELGLDRRGMRGMGVVDGYLAYQYGMRPLLQDVSGAVQSLSRRPPEEWRVTAKGAQADVYTRERIVTSTNGCEFKARTDYRQSARSVLSAVQRPLTRQQDLQWALGLDNPLATTWEVTRLSFVADWLVPVGDWLSALNSIKYYTGWQSCHTQYLKESVTYEGYRTPNPPAGYTFNTTCKGGGTSLRVVRSIVAGPPLAGLPIKDPRSISHMASALSLLASLSANDGEYPRLLRV